MAPVKVGVVGYGTIGRRLASAVLKQDDMKLVGVVKETPDYRARLALERGIPVFALNEENARAFRERGMKVSGVLEDLLQEVDVCLDASPEGIGAENRKLYERHGVRAIFQGGEEPEVAQVSFVAQCNYERAKGARFIRVVSCNTTALCRALGAVDEGFGIERAVAVLARRAADPHETSKGPIDAIVPDPVSVPSHHAEDVRTVLPGLSIVTMALKVPATHMHTHGLVLDLRSEASAQRVAEHLAAQPRILLVSASEGFKSTAHIMDYARELGRERGDLYEAVIWRDSIRVEGRRLYFFMAIHQEAIVAPENIDAIRASLGLAEKSESIAKTDRNLGILSGRLKLEARAAG
jgi:glyceraldehyde-3-phosphate dehydrogenase (NAD(P))